MKTNYTKPQLSIVSITPTSVMQAGSPQIGLIKGVHTPVEWATGGANADGGA